MSDGRDPAIKLFGTEIPLPEEEWDADVSARAIELPLEGGKDICNEKSDNEVPKPVVVVDTEETPCSSGLNNSTENIKITSMDTARSAEEQNAVHFHKEENTSGEEKALTKPDKNLTCPRCDSMDTKFCYYNNYNVNQPRHFCKNCQRYWTAGGTMRNVPIGAGRRKNKHSASSYRQMIVQTDGPDAAINAPKGSLKGGSTILKFGPDAPIYESMASMLNLGEKKIDLDLGSENREEPSCSSSVTASWNPGCLPGQENLILRSPILTLPAFCAPAYPFPFVPASFFGWNGGPWNFPWAGNENNCFSSPPNCSGNGSPTLGKHSREAERSLWIPKTLRIDDPDEAAKSSIFATLGIKLECGEFKTFQSNTGTRDASDAVKMLRSNPAALSRSQSFQEIS